MPENNLSFPSNSLESQDRPALSRRTFVRSATALLAAGATGALAQKSTHQHQLPDNASAIPDRPTGRPEPSYIRPKPGKRQFGYAVLGLGKYALNQIVPNFSGCQHARLAALITGNREKGLTVASEYGLPANKVYGYDDWDRIANDRDIDAVYVIVPNALHADFVLRAAKAGKHVMCEKPIEQCQAMIKATADAKRKFMIGYRVHFDRSTSPRCTSFAPESLESCALSRPITPTFWTRRITQHIQGIYEAARTGRPFKVDWAYTPQSQAFAAKSL